MLRPFFTIGHSNHTIDDFIALLKQHGVTVLADVRSHPYSHYCQHFRKAPLEGAIRKAGLGYVFLGQELGPRSTDPDCYINGTVNYERLAQTSLFHEGLERLVKGAKTHSIALMCAEHDPITCHRAILVSRPLHNNGHIIHHILRDGTLEAHGDLEERLLSLYALDNAGPDLASDKATSPHGKFSQANLQLNLLDYPVADTTPCPVGVESPCDISGITEVKQLEIFEDWLEPQLEKRRQAIATAYRQQGDKIAYRKE